MTREQHDTIVDALYKKCADGEISRNQREKLIQKATNMFLESADFTSIEKPSVEKQDTRVELTPSQKYAMFKESAYRKCANGDITIETREALLETARNKFFDTTD